MRKFSLTSVALKVMGAMLTTLSKEYIPKVWLPIRTGYFDETNGPNCAALRWLQYESFQQNTWHCTTRPLNFTASNYRLQSSLGIWLLLYLYSCIALAPATTSLDMIKPSICNDRKSQTLDLKFADYASKMLVGS